MGLFSKKPVPQSDKDRASNAFADRDKQTVSSDDGVADRIFGYNTLKGAETLHKVGQAQPGQPVDRIEELRRIRDAQQRDKEFETSGQISARAQADAAARSAAGDAITARKNLISSDGIARRSELSAEERAVIERQGMSHLGGITDTLKNKNLLTEIEGLGDTNNTSNLDDGEIDNRTAAFRNVGFITETEVDEYTRPLTDAEKLDKDLEELESAEKAISSFTNFGFRNNVVSSAMREEIVKEKKDEDEEEGEMI